MTLFFSNLRNRTVRAAIALVACVLMLLGAAAPAIAFGSSDSSPAKGTAEMNTLQEESERAVKAEPRNPEEVKGKAQEGPNEVQGRADLEQMNTQSGSEEATTVRKQVEDALENVTPGN